jgi:Homeodomain-like domain
VAPTAQDPAQRKKRFLAAYARRGNISQAAKAAGVPRRTVYEWREHDEAFVLALAEAEIEAKDAVELEIRRRAIEGWNDPVYQMGVRVGSIRKYSDVLLIFLAKRLMPEYRDKVTLDVNQVVREYRNLDTSRT